MFELDDEQWLKVRQRPYPRQQKRIKPDKLTKAQLAQIERIVNEQTRADLLITMTRMTLVEALKAGTLAFFEER